MTTTACWNATNGSACAPEEPAIWICGGSFDVSRLVGVRESSTETEPEFQSERFIICPTPEPGSWHREGDGRARLRVSLNGQEWSRSHLDVRFVTAPSVFSVVAASILPGGPESPEVVPPAATADWGRFPAETAILLRGHQFTAWPDVHCELRPRGERHPTAVVPSMLLSDEERACAVPRELRHIPPEDLTVQLLMPDGLTGLLLEEASVPVSVDYAPLSGGTFQERRPQILRVTPDWGWTTGGTLLRLHGFNLPPSLLNHRGEVAVRCDFGVAGIEDAVATGYSEVECVTPPVTDSMEVSVTVLIGAPPYMQLSHADARFRFLHRFNLAQITPVMGTSVGGTNITLTMTTRPLLFTDFGVDCAFGKARVPATLVQVAATAAGLRTHILRCSSPPAADISRLTKEGCMCKRRWFLPSGFQCDRHCCNPDGDPEGPRCYVESPECQGSDWGYCDSPNDAIVEGRYPACVRVVPSTAREVTEYEPCRHYFTYVTSPLIDSVVPDSGPISGGTNVTLRGRYIPYTNGLLCKFLTYVSPARWLSSSSLSCVSPAALGDSAGVMTVPVTISVNGGADWAPSTGRFSFLPGLTGFVVPDFGPQHGGTLLEIRVPRRYGQKVEVSQNQVEACCFGEPPTAIQPATRLSDTLYQCRTPPWPMAPATVSVGVVQADGRCQPLPRTKFVYVQRWEVMRIYPAVVSELDLGKADLLVSGEHFRAYSGARCRFGGEDGPTSRADVLEWNHSLTCRVPSSLDLSQSPAGRTVEVRVAMNGVDFVGGTPPVTVHLAEGNPMVISATPAHVYAVGQYPVTIHGDNFGPNLRVCIFGEGDRIMEVPLGSLASAQQIVCMAPAWNIQPTGAPMERVPVRVAADGVSNALGGSAFVTFVAVPEVDRIEPNEGPSDGGTRVRAVGRHFLPAPRDEDTPELPQRPLRCVFGFKDSPALVLSDTELLCTAPPVEGAYRGKGHLAAFSVTTVPAYPRPPDNTVPAVGPARQVVFFYRHFVVSFSVVEPLSGPEFGDTLVSLRSDYPLLNSRLLKCVFGDSLVDLFIVSAYEATCKSPPHEPGIVPFTLSTDGQNRLELGPNGSPLRFLYYLTPTVSEVLPPIGMASGGTMVQILGSHFIDSGRLTCRFGTTDTRAVRFISSHQILCRTPKMAAGRVQVVVSNNGQNFTGNSDAGFDFTDILFFHLNPYLGPITGGTNVLVETQGISSLSQGLIRCTFGDIAVVGRFVNDTHISCISPSVLTPGEVPIFITLNLQDRIEASQQFLYYMPPTISDVDPPLVPVSQSLSLRIIGHHFVNTDFLTVRFGGRSVEPENHGYLELKALYVNQHEAVVDLPSLTYLTDVTHMPLYISNNAQNFSPEGVGSWDPDDDSHDVAKGMKYITFHDHMRLKEVDPTYGMLYGGGFVSVFGYGFLNTSKLMCSFSWIDSPSAIYVSSTHVMCEVPNMLAAHSTHALGNAKLRLTLNGRDWSRSALDFRFLGLCPIGHFCQHSSYEIFTIRVLPCPAGHFCESEGMSEPSPCAPGTYQPFRRQVQCQYCPAGFYCPKSRMIEPLACARGWVCDEIGLTVPYKRCPKGHYCGEGVATMLSRVSLQLEGMKPRPCPAGLHCYEGAVAVNSKPHNLTTPQPCFQGHFCPPGSSTPYGAGACPLGKYCPTPRHAGLVCPERYMCGPLPGNMEPIPCPAGTFNPWLGQWNCTLCLEGSVCPRSRLRMPVKCPCGYECSTRGMYRVNRLCPAGLMCEEGVATMIEPQICEPREFAIDARTDLDRVRTQICDYTIGQVFVDIDRILRVPKVYERWGWDPLDRMTRLGKGACCWDEAKVKAWLTSLAEDYRTRAEMLSSRTFYRLEELFRVRTVELQASAYGSNGMDGLEVLAINETQWRVEWQVLYPKARSEFMHNIEKVWTWSRPLPCPPGSFCRAGTCPRFAQTGIVVVDFNKESQANLLGRRLASKHHDDFVRFAFNDTRPSDGPAGPRSGRRMAEADEPPTGCNGTSGDWAFTPRRLFEGGLQGSTTSNATNGSFSFQDAPRSTTQPPGSNYSMFEAPGSPPSNCSPSPPESSPFRLLGVDLGGKVAIGAPAVRHGSVRSVQDLYAPPEASLKLAAALLRRQILEMKVEETPSFGLGPRAPLRRAPSRRLRAPNGSLSSSNASLSIEEQLVEEWLRRLQSSQDPLPAYSPLAYRAPQQCLAGRFCNARASSAQGTGLCPRGQFCPPGAPEPQEAPEGVFVGEAGRVRGVQCFPGLFAPTSDTPTCYACPPGASCPDFGTTVPFICPPGTFREPPLGNGSASSISCMGCGPGTWAPWRGTPDWSSCEPCPEGRVCYVGTGNVSMGTECPEGHVCGEGTTPDSQTAFKCYAGFYCGASTTKDSVWRSLCVAGFYCDIGTTFAVRYKFRCKIGFYCPTGTAYTKDLDRPHVQDTVYLGKKEFYLMQKVAMFCTRQRMMFIAIDLRTQSLSAQTLGLPPMEEIEIRANFQAWKKEFLHDRTCQREAVSAVMRYYGRSLTKLEEIQSIDFLEKELLKELDKHAADHSNKCINYNPESGGGGWPENKCVQGMPCRRDSQLKCLCTTRDPNMMIMSCFGSGYPDPDCVDAPGSKDAYCLDKSLEFEGNIAADDFDVMAGHHLQYTMSSMEQEMRIRHTAGEGSMTRCPFGTMTASDGKAELRDCDRRINVGYLQENLEMIVGTVNPLNPAMSMVNATKTQGDPAVQETFRRVFRAPAGTVFLVTFDMRHMPMDLRYGQDWRIKFFVNDTLSPAHDDPIQCGDILNQVVLAGPNRRPDRLISVARLRRCTELRLPPSWEREVEEGPVPVGGGVFTFMMHPLVDSEWRMEVQIINGKYLPDRFMFIDTAVVEYIEPHRAHVGTNERFATLMSSGLKIELPTNMPLKSFDDDPSRQRVLTNAFLNWLPVNSPLKNYMRAPVRGGEREYIHPEKRTYFGASSQIMLPYLPYFSNCRGFGRTIPLWAILEQSKTCNWAETSREIGELSLGAEAVGDTCKDVKVECLLDEIPNVKMPSQRWFEAPSGTMLFYMLKESVPGGFGEPKELPVVEPVYLMAGVKQQGSLPKKVSIVIQYWQRTPKQKIFAQGRVYFSDFELQPAEAILRGEQKWQYDLQVFFFPMTHFEVMVSFAFPFHFYLVLYLCTGVICAGTVLILWCYHRLLSHFPIPPRLWDRRVGTCIMMPLFRGSCMAFAVMFMPLFVGTGLIRGDVFGFRFPFANCPSGALPDRCFLGLLDWVQSSYSGESAVTKTNYGERRTGRTGVILAVMGGYATMVALKLFILPTESHYYKREDSSGKGGKMDLVTDDSSEENDKKANRNNEAQVYGAEPDERGLMPIFTTHLWKRSSLALLMYANAILQQCVLQWSYSNFFREHVLTVLVCLHLFRSLIRLAVTDYMCETMLMIPIHTVSQVTYMVSLLASKTLFDFLTAYIIVSGIQMIDRVYVSPMEDFVINKLMKVIRQVRSYLEWVRSLRRNAVEKNTQEDEDSDEDDAAGQDASVRAAVEADRRAAEAEGDTEDMIGFCVGLSTDAVGNLLAPLFFALCAWLYDESQILYLYGIRVEHAGYYVFFYAIQFLFQFITDILSINTVELFHGWHVVDYFEYCMYRFKIRRHVWKGRETAYDENLAPHQRSVDQMCFSEQFYFMNTLCVCGMLAWMFGMQVIFVNQWNLFDDPATPIIMLAGLSICRGAHLTTLISAGYLKVWMVKKEGVHTNEEELILPGQVLEARRKLLQPTPPPGSCHDSWPEPPPYDKEGLERFRMAFLRENQLWLQAAFAEMDDRRVIVEQRGALLEQLAGLINELPPSNFGPSGGQGGEADNVGLRFGEMPPAGVARAAREVQHANYDGSIAQEIVKMWKQRAQFMLHLQRVTETIKLERGVKRSYCEVCGKTGLLEVAPIYTLMHLASNYRQQRDMSPLWNAPLWRHFYQTFTPTCTICDVCSQKHYRMNRNVPVDEGRFQRLQAKKKTVHTYVMESSLPVAPIDSEAVEILHVWLGFTKALAGGEDPRSFLPRFGFEGRTNAEIRRTRIMEQAEENADNTSLPSLSESEEEKSEDEAAAAEEEEEEPKPKGREIQDVTQIDLDEEEPPERPMDLRAPLTWSEIAIMGGWLRRARQRLQAPQLSDWSRPLAGPQSPDPPPPPPDDDSEPANPNSSVSFG